MNFLKKLFEPAYSPDSDPSHSRDLTHVEQALAHLPKEQARYLAGFSLLLARVAHADLHVSENERRRIHEALEKESTLSADQVELVTSLALERATAHSVEDHIVMRELNAICDRAKRAEIIRSLLHVAAADDITEQESEEVWLIARAMLFSRQEYLSLRNEFREHVRVLR